MSAWAERRAEPSAVHLTDADEALGPLWVRLVVFFAVTTLSALAYERLLHDPPVGVAFAVAGAATACGAALTFGLGAVGRMQPEEQKGRRARAARDAVALLAALVGIALGLLAVGVPVHLLVPWHWGSLASDVERGLGPLGAWNWPYLGSSHWARLTVLMLLVPATTVMALLFFWPTRAGAAARRLCGLAIAVALALCGHDQLARQRLAGGGPAAGGGRVRVAVVADDAPPGGRPGTSLDGRVCGRRADPGAAR